MPTHTGLSRNSLPGRSGNGFFSEVIIGRRSHANAYGAFKKLAPGTKWKWLGVASVITPIIVVSYYSVIGGWSLEYFFKSCMFEFTEGATQAELGSMFDKFITSVWPPLVGHTIFLLLTGLVIIAGVKNLFKPDFSKIDGEVCSAALGQAFFSLSLGVGTMLTYGSYIKKDENIAASSSYTAVSDFIFALIASCAILPAVFAFGLNPQEGPGLVFQTLPFIFSNMPMGGFIAIIFFLALIVAAITSSISLYEVGVAYLVEERDVSRKKASVIVFVVAWFIGALCSLSFGPLSDIKIFGQTIFNFFDKLSANFLMTIGGFLMVVFVGWKMGKSDVFDEFTNSGTLSANKRIFKFVYFMIRYVCPIAVLMIFLSGLLF